MTSGTRAVALSGIVLLVVGLIVVAAVLARPAARTVADVLASPTPAPALPPEESLEPGLSPDPSLEPSPSPSTTPPIAGTDPILGADGRLTLLLLGSDYRPSHPGNRTDAIIVVSVDPVTGANAAFSVPRDAVNFPLPGGGTYGPKVTGLYAYLGAKTGDAGKAMKAAVSRAFGIEVDRYVFIGFTGVKSLVRAVGGVDVTLDAPYYDPEYWVTSKQRGWGLPRGTSHLNGNDALIFARSRKGDNDFGRARRQQILIMAAFDKVRARGIANLPELIAIARSTVRTDLPLDRAGDVYNLFSKVDLGKAKRVVFGPRSYASGLGGTDFALRLDVCRAWIAKNFPPPRTVARAPSPSGPPSSASPAP
jgi:LCP family protein required for cell wall assembly